MKINDANLLKRIARKDAEAFDILYERYFRLFYRWVYTRTSSKEMSENVVQNFWMKIWTDPEYFKHDTNGSAKNFFLQTLTFQMLDYLKSASVRSLGDEHLIDEAENTLTYTHVLEELEEEDIRGLIKEVLDSLPPSYTGCFLAAMGKGVFG